jgi:alpha-L-fucosidase
VYGTRAGPVGPQHWGVSTRKEGAIYLHVFAPDGKITLPKHLQAHDARVLGAPKGLPLKAEGLELTLELPDDVRTPIDTIVVLRPIVDGQPQLRR